MIDSASPTPTPGKHFIHQAVTEDNRTGRFGGRVITVVDLASMVVDHDRVHREELQRLVASLPAP